jgi:hypothetical protein
MKNAIPSALVLGALALSSGCAPLTQEELDEEIALEGVEQAINHGTLVTANNSPYNAVVRIRNAGNSCTATKIGPKRFLTAAHCITELQLVSGEIFEMSNLLISDDLFFVTATGIWTHPFFEHNPWPAQSPDVAVFDVNANSAEDAATLSAIPTRAVSSSYVVDGALGLQLVGYGVDSSDSTRFMKKQKASLTPRSLYNYRTARPTRSAALSLSEYTANVIAEGAGGAWMNGGDSGGPLLNTSWDIVGVASFSSDEVPGYSFLARTHNVYEWIGNPQKNQFYTTNYGFLFNAGSNKCMGTSSTASGASIWQKNCDARTSSRQRWYLWDRGDGYFQLLNLATDPTRCLSTAANGGLTLAACTVDQTLHWKPVLSATGYYRWVNRVTGKCIGNAGVHDESSLLKQVTCNTLVDQRFIFTR